MHGDKAVCQSSLQLPVHETNANTATKVRSHGVEPKTEQILVFFLMSMHLPIAWAIILVDSPFGILYVAIEILQVLP